jgi:hypothetical protein
MHHLPNRPGRTRTHNPHPSGHRSTCNWLIYHGWLGLIVLIVVFFQPIFAGAAQVTLAWDPNDPAPDGYRVYQRVEGDSYDYESPVWPGPDDDPTLTTCTITGLADDTLYYFVVRAWVGSDISGDSNEAAHQTAAAGPQTHIISATAGANGSISPSGMVSVYEGDDQHFDFSANPGYHISNVQVNGQSIGAVASYTFSNVTGNHTISVSFAVDTHTISASAGSGGSIAPAGSVNVAGGSGQTFTFTPNNGYHVAGITVDGQSIGAASSYTFSNVTGNHTISVSFAVDTHTISASAGSGGSIAPAGSVNVAGGSGQTFTFTPNNGYHVAGITVDGQSIGAASSYTFSNVTGNHTISVSFAVDTHTISASAGSGGSIAPAGSVNVAGGSGQTFTFTPNNGYHVAGITVDGQSIGAASSYTFSNVTGNHTIAVSFSADTHTISASAGSGGAISPAGSVNLAQGGSQSFIFTPHSGYLVATVVVDGQSVGSVENYTFSNVSGNHTISVSFTAITHRISASAGVGGTISPDGSVTVAHTGSQDFIITPNTGYVTKEVRVDGVSAGPINAYHFSAISADHTISATFEPGNQTPQADAGANTTIQSEGSATLNGSASKDPEGEQLTYRWTQTNSPAAAISNPAAALTSITAPRVIDTSVTLVFELTVTDPQGLSSTDTCLVRVDPTQSAVDTDGDGTPDSEDNDDDDDGMPDSWEMQFGLDPLVKNADGDPDNDGVTNYQEYRNGTHPLQAEAEDNRPPTQPTLTAPSDLEMSKSRMVWLRASDFDDPDAGDKHQKSQWRITTSDGLREAFNRTSRHRLTVLPIPRLVLRESASYSAMVRFYDNEGAASQWSDPVAFTTPPRKYYPSASGIPEGQEADAEQAAPIKTSDAQYLLAASLEGEDAGGTVLDTVESIDPMDLETTLYASSETPFGLLGYRIEVAEPGSSATVSLQLSPAVMADDTLWVCYNSIDEWRDCSATTFIDPGGGTATRTIADGGIYDADGTANGTIVEISGPLVSGSTPDSSLVMTDTLPSGSSDSGGASCFITSLFK